MTATRDPLEKAVKRGSVKSREAALEAEIADLRAQITDPRTVTITRTRYEEYQAAEERLAAYEGLLTAEEMRERCADVADTCDSPYGCATQEQDYACSDMAYRIAAAIRALSTKREEEYELVCVNGHDCCWAGPFDNCPYCERRTPYTKREEG